ncbi:MAG: leucyl aminopeptidase [Desulfobacteraceae bacterium]|nr:leucyl aminopeptidase [Desulfobacteraceae bacterium]
MNIEVKTAKVRPQSYAGDLAVHFVREGENDGPASAGAEVRELVSRAVAAGDFAGKEGQTLLVYPGGRGPKRVLVAGLGSEKVTPELLRNAGGRIAAAAGKTKTEKLLVTLPAAGLPPGEAVRALTEGLVLGAYTFRKHKSQADPEDEGGELREILFPAGGGAAARTGIAWGRAAAAAVCAARDMANEPANFMTPTRVAELARDLAGRYGLAAKVLGKKELEKLKMGGILGVNRGSAEPPTLSVLEYRTGRKAPTLLLVGKGLTFDSGGYSLKPAAGMHEMKYDMCGAAAVLGAMQAVGELAPPGLDVVAVVPATENLVGPAALKPGDVITQYGGKTVEVMNTDAEGRLILADALAYGIERYKPDFVIDLATLTGAAIIALGHHRTGLLGNDDGLAARVLAAGEAAGEPLWRLPLGPEYGKQLKSRIADLKNVDKRDGGTILAACFLQEFVGKIPWAHLDIAGTAWDFTDKPYIPKGPSGVGVRTLLELIRGWK